MSKSPHTSEVKRDLDDMIARSKEAPPPPSRTKQKMRQMEQVPAPDPEVSRMDYGVEMEREQPPGTVDWYKLTPSELSKELKMVGIAPGHILNRLCENPRLLDSKHYNELGDAKRFCAVFADRVRYVRASKSWLCWDGKRWGKDETGHVDRLVKLVVGSMLVQAAELKSENGDCPKALLTRMKLARSARGIRSILELVATELPVAAKTKDFDSDPWLLTCLNGTLNLKTGKLQPHRREDLITKLVPATYNPDAKSAVWDAFLDRVVPDSDSRNFIQRAAGYSLTGSTAEEKLFLVDGPAATGKSTFLESFRATLGDYATKADFSAFVKKRDSSGPSNDIARLDGARFVLSAEVDSGRRLAEGLVKMLTGGDTITARFLFSEAFTFKPTLKLWLCANDRPQARDDDSGLWRRILRLPFDEEISESEQDPSIKETLSDPEKSGAAILAWAVRGCGMWQKSGLGIPDKVREATAFYRASMDPLASWLDECCEITLPDESYELSSALWDSYLAYEKGRKISRKEFGNRLKEKGFMAGQIGHSKARIWRGLRTRADG